MKWTGLNELRETFLEFFVSKGHTRLPSAPLVPQDEASLLLINSGMAPLKKYFTRQKFLPNGSFRATSCQKCIRTPDIEHVGKTARHGTYFEMLGNFSFGDYFKEERYPLGLGVHHREAGAARSISSMSLFTRTMTRPMISGPSEVGVAPDHMVRLGKEDNFWEIGSGPCGPCSEIYFDRGREVRLRPSRLRMSAATATAMLSSGTWYSPSSIQRRRGPLHPLGAQEHRYRHGPGAPGLHHAGGGQPL